MHPAPVIELHGAFLVVRDDLIAGGTKARVLPALLTGAREFVYASPAFGYAQVALAHAARAAGVQATIFVARRAQLHPRTAEAEAGGARIVQVNHGYMTVVQARARSYCAVSGARLLPFGFDVPIIRDGLTDLARTLDVDPPEVWTVAGTGTLSRALQAAWPRARFVAIRIGALPRVGDATLLHAPERFEQPARIRPPFPSCSNYDAKAWRFIQTHASRGALFWNVAA